MTYGAQTFSQMSVEEFNSSAEHTLFLIDQQQISGSSVGAGIFFMYADYAGLQVSAELLSPYQTGDINGWAVLSCRVVYTAAKVPQISVFVDNTSAGLPVCDGYLRVYLTGGTI